MSKKWSVVLVLVVSCMAVSLANAAPTDRESIVRRLEQRVAAQDQLIADLQAKQKGNLTPAEQQNFLALYKEIKADAQQRSQANDLRLYWKDGIRMETRDKKFKLKFGGRLMVDYGWIDGSGIEKDLGVDLEDGVEIRRARLYVAGDWYKDLAFKLQFDFAGGDADMKDAYLKFKNVPWLGNVYVGHVKEPFSLEELPSSKYIPFLERALPNVFVPGRNVGVMAQNHAFNKRATWAAGVFRDTDDFGNGQADGGNAYNLTARGTWVPLYEDKGRRVVHLGTAFSLRHPEDPVRYRQRPEAHFTERFTDTGEFGAEWLHVFGAEAAWVHGPFSLQGEYITVAVDAPEINNACFFGTYVQASYFLTGENRVYDTKTGVFKRVKPKRNFREDGGLGAWEVAGRWSHLDLTDGQTASTARRMNNYTLGLNWHLNPNVRFMWNYIRSQVSGPGVSNDADIFMMRMQYDF